MSKLQRLLAREARALLLRRKKALKDDRPAWLVVGLGNPGSRYSNTRHNAGARSVERLATQLNARMKTSRLQALVAEGRSEGLRVAVARPMTWYNDSGIAIRGLLEKLNVSTDRLVVVHDDIDLRAHTLRIKFGGRSGGNHGVESTEKILGVSDFYRVRIGVGRPRNPRQDPADFVLEPMPKKVAEEFAVTEAQAADAVLSLIHDGLDRAMNLFNTR